MVLLLAGMLAMFFGAARAHDGDDHDASANSNPTVRDLAQRLPDGGVFVPKSIQRILAIRTVQIESAAHRAALELPGRIIPDPNASGFVQSSVGGRLSPPPNGFPRLGTPVRKGDVLAYMTPPLQAIDASDMRQRQGELDQQISIVERRLARYETLVPSGAIARTQLEDTRTELQGLKDRRGSLDKSRRNEFKRMPCFVRSGHYRQGGGRDEKYLPYYTEATITSVSPNGNAYVVRKGEKHGEKHNIRWNSDIILDTPANRKLIVDFAGLDYMSSRGLRALTLAKRQAHAAGMTRALARPNEVMREIMAISRYDKLFAVSDTIEGVL